MRATADRKKELFKEWVQTQLAENLPDFIPEHRIRLLFLAYLWDTGAYHTDGGPLGEKPFKDEGATSLLRR